MAHASLRQPHYSPATSADLALLDMLTTQATPGQAAASQHVKRPLATLAALRRPPIDPIILAASLSTGPHVTRHHFHHSYGAPRPAASKQMPVAERRARREAAAAALAAQASATQAQHRSARSQSIGGYASCNLTDDALASSSSATQPHEHALHAQQDDILAGIIDDVPAVTDEERALYASRQAPRSVRLKAEAEAAARRRATAEANERPAAASEAQALQRQTSFIGGSTPSTAAQAQLSEALHSRQALLATRPAPLSLGSLPHAAPLLPPQGGQATPMSLAGLSSIVRPPPLNVRCYARTRIPTPHGEVFCHLYRNNHDAKEHLALVVDPAQNSDATQRALLQGGDGAAPTGARKHLRSCTLDEVWSPQETEMERIVRGAYVGRLGPGFQQASSATRLAAAAAAASTPPTYDEDEAPLVRIHSECYTGETIGSQRCDCGEQLDEAIRLIHAAAAAGSEARGVVVYLRQEGRGIGLLDKLMAYNLQDMGHDTVSANVLLGHLPDARKYDVAAAILRDLGVGACKLLTNNPDKMEALEREGVRVTQRVAMVPRAWREELGAASRRRKAARRKASRARTTSAGASLARRKKRQPMDASILSQAPSPRADSPLVDSSFTAQQQQQHSGDSADEDADSYYSESDEAEAEAEYVDHVLRRSGATMLGASVTRGVELEKYLRTKVERMGHMLDLPPPHSNEASGASTPAIQHAHAHAHAPAAAQQTHPLARSYSATQVQELPLTPGTDGGAQLGAGAADGNGTDPDSLLGEAELDELELSADVDVRSQPDEETVLVQRRTSAA